MNIKRIKTISLILGIITWLFPFVLGFMGKINIKLAILFFVIGGLFFAIHLFIEDILVKYCMHLQLFDPYMNIN